MRRIIAAAAALFFIAVLPIEAKKVTVIKQFHDSFPTNVKGTSLAAPPRIQVIRSERGATYMITGFKRINNRSAHARLKKLKKLVDGVDFSKHMLIAIFSPQMDNYNMKLKEVVLEEDLISVNLSYLHKTRDYLIPPKKSIHYLMLVVKKTEQPVLLNAKQIKIKSKVKAVKKVTVTGRLMRWKDSALQLIPVKIRRGKKNSYYIMGEQSVELEPYLGRIVTLRGTISHERDGPYESVLTVQKLVKASD